MCVLATLLFCSCDRNIVKEHQAKLSSGTKAESAEDPWAELEGTTWHLSVWAGSDYRFFKEDGQPMCRRIVYGSGVPIAGDAVIPVTVRSPHRIQVGDTEFRFSDGRLFAGTEELRKGGFPFPGDIEGGLPQPVGGANSGSAGALPE